MRFGVVVFPGSNCDEDIYYVLNSTLKQDTVKIWHKDTCLKSCDFIILPGGFSYGDYLRCGAIASISPIMNIVIDFAKKGGYVMGICNGFQILTETYLLPGVLLRNINQKFICSNQYIKPLNNHTILTRGLLNDKFYNIPIAHSEGRYFASDDIVKELEDNEQILFQYVDNQGIASEEGNPNGSMRNIAGICNKKGNVLGMMPHPERASSEILGNIDGKFLFDSIIAYTG